jgi:hypothetical protein
MTGLFFALFITFSTWFGDGNLENFQNENTLYSQSIPTPYDGGEGEDDGYEDIWSDEFDD